ncbi:MAG: DinB family protein [Acidobacteria bacterium]|nr:DinB family protein [Acidobacteriota bacterium]
MTHYGAKELGYSFRQVRGNTLEIANEIPESQYGFKASPESRSIAQTLVHIAFAPDVQEHVHRQSFTDAGKVPWGELIQKVGSEEGKPRTKAEIVELLQSRGDAFASYLEGLSDSFLAERVSMPPGLGVPSKSRFEMLLSPKEHEMHHRGQLMMMQRMIGQVPPLTRRMLERAAQAARA